MIDYNTLLEIWDRNFEYCFSAELKDTQIHLDMDKRDGNWWNENRRMEFEGNPIQERMVGKKQSSIMHCPKTGNVVCHLFGFGSITPAEREVLNSLMVAENIDPTQLIGIGGLHVPANTELPYHIDVVPIRWNWANTFVVSGLDADISLYVDDKKVFKFSGLRRFQLYPHYVVHGAVTKSEPLKLLQFLTKNET